MFRLDKFHSPHLNLLSRAITDARLAVLAECNLAVPSTVPETLNQKLAREKFHFSKMGVDEAQFYLIMWFLTHNEFVYKHKLDEREVAKRAVQVRERTELAEKMASEKAAASACDFLDARAAPGVLACAAGDCGGTSASRKRPAAVPQAAAVSRKRARVVPCAAPTPRCLRRLCWSPNEHKGECEELGCLANIPRVVVMACRPLTLYQEGDEARALIAEGTFHFRFLNTAEYGYASKIHGHRWHTRAAATDDGVDDEGGEKVTILQYDVQWLPSERRTWPRSWNDAAPIQDAAPSVCADYLSAFRAAHPRSTELTASGWKLADTGSLHAAPSQRGKPGKRRPGDLERTS